MHFLLTRYDAIGLRQCPGCQKRIVPPIFVVKIPCKTLTIQIHRSLLVLKLNLVAKIINNIEKSEEMVVNLQIINTCRT